MIKHPTHLPAGLEDSSLEIYTYKDELRVLYKGKAISFSKLPKEIIAIFRNDLEQNNEARKSLRLDFKIKDQKGQLVQYVKCRYGGFDFTPDLTNDGKINPEAWDCGRKHACCGYGKICPAVEGPHGKITPGELRVMRLVCDGHSDKLIADKLNISINTELKHMNNIRHKLNVYSRQEIVIFSNKINLFTNAR